MFLTRIRESEDRVPHIDPLRKVSKYNLKKLHLAYQRATLASVWPQVCAAYTNLIDKNVGHETTCVRNARSMLTYCRRGASPKLQMADEKKLWACGISRLCDAAENRNHFGIP
jgi:hypothetical protein